MAELSGPTHNKNYRFCLELENVCQAVNGLFIYWFNWLYAMQTYSPRIQT